MGLFLPQLQQPVVFLCAHSAHLVVRMVDGEVAYADDDLMQQFLRAVLRAVPQQRTHDVSKGQRQSLSSQNRLGKNNNIKSVTDYHTFIKIKSRQIKQGSR